MAGVATAFEVKVAAALRAAGSDGELPANLSAAVWGESPRRGAAPGTARVRPMLAALARMRKKGLVDWHVPDRGHRVHWYLTALGRQLVDGV